MINAVNIHLLVPFLNLRVVYQAICDTILMSFSLQGQYIAHIVISI